MPDEGSILQRAQQAAAAYKAMQDAAQQAAKDAAAQQPAPSTQRPPAQ